MKREDLIEQIGMEIVQFQEESAAFDDVAASILALDRRDLPVMTVLLFGGPASVGQLSAALHLPQRAVATTVERLQLAGYAHAHPERIELTAHARQWIETIWSPLREAGERLMGTYSTRELALMHGFMKSAREVQQRHAARLRKWTELPSSPARKPHLRGGLSPAALRRVQVFIESNLERTIHLRDLAGRAGLSLHHFARAFKTSIGVTPRAYIEEQRIERAKRLLAETRQPLADIAIEAGFGTQSRFTTAFRRRTGFTPARWRGVR